MVVMLMAMMVGSIVIILIVPTKTKKRERKHDVEELGSNAEQVVVRGVGSTDRPIVDSSHIVLSPTTYFPIHPPHPSLPPPKPSAYHNLTLKQTFLECQYLVSSSDVTITKLILCPRLQTGKNSKVLEHFLGMARMPRGEQDDHPPQDCDDHDRRQDHVHRILAVKVYALL